MTQTNSPANPQVQDMYDSLREAMDTLARGEIATLTLVGTTTGGGVIDKQLFTDNIAMTTLHIGIQETQKAVVVNLWHRLNNALNEKRRVASAKPQLVSADGKPLQ
jgi:hypothetical protein